MILRDQLLAHMYYFQINTNDLEVFQLIANLGNGHPHSCVLNVLYLAHTDPPPPTHTHTHTHTFGMDLCPICQSVPHLMASQK